MPDVDEMFAELEAYEGIEPDDRRIIRHVRQRWEVESIVLSRKQRTRLLEIYNKAKNVTMPCRVADNQGRCPWLTRRRKAPVSQTCPYNNSTDQARCEGYRSLGKPGYAEVPE